MKSMLVDVSVRHPRWVIVIAAIITLVAMAQMPKVKIDTDPENMLRADAPVRVVHHQVKEAFELNDFLVVGIVHEPTVFRPDILARVRGLTEVIAKMDGVIADDIIAPGEVDVILPDAAGGVRVEALMAEMPTTDEEAQTVLLHIMENPVLRGKLASADGQAMALFIPLESKDVAEDVANGVRAHLATLDTEETYYLAGLPLAEDSFGSAMFRQMAISAPMAFLLIFLLMLFFFRVPAMVIAPMLVAMMTVIWTMGLLIGMGFTLHIMSSMIPVFLMPIAVLDSIHILSEVHDHYRATGDMRQTMRKVVRELFKPMTFTSVTTIVGFSALILTPIPPVQVFGAFVAVGVFVAWLLSLTFNPAYAVLLPASALQKFGAAHEPNAAPESHLRKVYHFSQRFRVPLTLGLVAILAVAGYGISQVEVNDNPVNWFKAGHPLRVADKVMNEHLAGTYIAYIQLAGEEEGAFLEPAWMQYAHELQQDLTKHANVGAVSSVVDVVQKVQFELLSRPEPRPPLPDTREELAQLLFVYEMSGGTPDDLFKFITPEQDKINLWLQMPRGENRDVQSVIHAAEAYVLENPLPAGMSFDWAGLSYINVEWQRQMVRGMGMALMGSFATVLIMMMILFRSLRLALVAMIPLTVTIVITYGFVGLTGRPYDMPTAVLSSLSLGLSIDFAIHLIQRTREIHRVTGDFEATMHEFFHSPAQALARNIVVIALGFIPMFFAGLAPYVKVGAFFFAIMIISGGATFLILPPLLSRFSTQALVGKRAEPTEPSAAPVLEGTS